MASITASVEIDGVVARLTESRTRGVDWLASRVADDGEPAGAKEFNLYYRVPWALAIGGRLDKASAALSWIERHALTQSGDLRPGAPQTNWNRVGWTRDAASYPLAIIATGAWHLEHYDTALAIMDTLEAYQNPETGGGFVERPEHRTTGRQDILCTAQLGLAALATGRRPMADAAFRWMERYFAAQPELPKRLYLCWNDQGLITDAPADQAFGYYLDFAKPRQAYFNPGIGAAFLGRYYMVTRIEAAREIGRGLLRPQDDATELQFDYADTVHVGKFGWGAAAMLDVDPSEEHLKRAIRMANWYIDSQSEDGRWNPTHFHTADPKDPDALWKSGEHIMLMSMVLGALIAYPRRIG